MASFNRDSDFLALDFDGVIADSIEECLVVGHNAFALYNPSPNTITNISQLDSHTISEARRLRSFIRSGQDYVYIFKALHLRTPIRNQSDFDQFTAAHQSDHDLFFDLFYRVRAELSGTHPEAWAGLSPLYSGIKPFLSSFPKERLFVVTSKKTGYAAIILRHNQINIQADHMIRASEEFPKQMILKQLADTLNVPPSAFYFVDDQVDTLIQVQTTGARCFLAEWGYNNQDQISQARTHGIPVLSLTAFLNRF